jgi:hypothetical protein
MSGEDAPRPYLENLIVLEIKTNKHRINNSWVTSTSDMNQIWLLNPNQNPEKMW